MKKIGILGGGQLGMLLAQSIVRLGAEACVYDPDPEAPACRAARYCVNADWNDKESLTKFLAACDKATYEFENVPYESLSALNKTTSIYPSLNVLKVTQNRAHEKDFLRQHGLPHVPYIIAEDAAELMDRIDALEFPIIVKSTTGGYDGKGQVYLRVKEELKNLFRTGEKANLSFPVLAEQAINLYKEVSCITGRDLHGREIVFPIFENIHSNHILDTTLMPARLNEKMIAAIQALAIQASTQLDVVGLLCTEFFIERVGENSDNGVLVDEFAIYINEFAPRPHNSGHATISGCTLSQFDILARILLDLPISAPVLVGNGYFCMANMLGDIWLAQGTAEGDKLNLANLVHCKELVDLIIYGKKHARPGRKMGHLITHASEAEQALAAAKLIRENLKAVKVPL